MDRSRRRGQHRSGTARQAPPRWRPGVDARPRPRPIRQCRAPGSSRCNRRFRHGCRGDGILRRPPHDGRRSRPRAPPPAVTRLDGANPRRGEHRRRSAPGRGEPLHRRASRQLGLRHQGQHREAACGPAAPHRRRPHDHPPCDRSVVHALEGRHLHGGGGAHESRARVQRAQRTRIAASPSIPTLRRSTSPSSMGCSGTFIAAHPKTPPWQTSSMPTVGSGTGRRRTGRRSRSPAAPRCTAAGVGASRRQGPPRGCRRRPAARDRRSARIRDRGRPRRHRVRLVHPGRAGRCRPGCRRRPRPLPAPDSRCRYDRGDSSGMTRFRRPACTTRSM